MNQMTLIGLFFFITSTLVACECSDVEIEFLYDSLSYPYDRPSDNEIECLLTSLSNPYDPSLEDYRLIEDYYQYGQRPYLEFLRRKYTGIRTDIDFRIEQLRNLKLVGANGEMPIREIRAMNVREETKDCCILIYGSFNDSYPQKAIQLFKELQDSGYSGYVMMRIGGIPNVGSGGAKLALSPYTWRIDFFREARLKGFTKILYLEASLHPLTDLSTAFDVINSYGFLTCTGEDSSYFALMHNLQEVSNPIDLGYSAPWLHGSILGLNFNNTMICELFERWDHEMHKYYYLGDDIIFTFLAWQLGLRPYYACSDIIEYQDFHPMIVPPRHLFYEDAHKIAIRSGWGALFDYGSSLIIESSPPFLDLESMGIDKKEE